MQDKTPPPHDSLSHLPPQAYFDEQKALAKLLPIADDLAALVQKARAPQCLHQNQEPAPVQAAVDTPVAAKASPTFMTADQACKWAWSAIRDDVGTEGWTAADSGNFYGFFLHGWNYRGQYELQRSAARELMAVPDAVRDAEKLLRAEAARLDHIYGAGKWYGFSAEKASHLEHLRVADALAATPVAATESVLIDGVAYTIPEPVAHELLRLHIELQQAPVPVVLPEPDAVISEVMALVDEWGMESHLRGEAELDAHRSEATQEEIDCAKDRASKERAAWKAIESKLRALLATDTGLPVQAVETVQMPPVTPEQFSQDIAEMTGDALDDTALLNAMERQRIAVVPEYEGPWDAGIYNDEGEPIHAGSGSTPREAIRAAIAASKE